MSAPLASITTATCAVCGCSWQTMSKNPPRACSRCRSRLTKTQKRDDPSTTEAERRLDELIADETRMPWERKKRR